MDARRGARSPSPNRARAPRTPASPGAAAASGAQRQPVPPDSPGDGDTGALRDRLDALAGRLIGLEASVQALQSGAQTALTDLVAQARSEFDPQRNSNLSLRFDIQEEAGTLRRYLEETR